MRTPTAISLFSGCGGMDLAFDRAGFQTVLQCEIEPKRRSVLARHWPETERVNDVSELRLDRTRPEGGTEPGDATRESLRADRTEPLGRGTPVGVVYFGSPCQDLSLAGKRAGLTGERSGLFFEAVRILRESGARFALWENVGGARSNNEGEDFRAALSALWGAELPMPRSGDWARSGMVRGAGRSLAWRHLDAQYHGLAQQRVRVFALLDTRSGRAGEILFEPEGLRGHPETGGKAREETAGTVGGGAYGSGRRSEDDPNLVVAAFDPRMISLPGNRSAAGHNKPSGSLHTQPQAVAIRTDHTQGNGSYIRDELAYTLDGVQQAVAYPPDTAKPVGSATGGFRADLDNATYVPETAYACGARDGKGIVDKDATLISHGWKVRRLTPLECERLQGMPDDWTRWDQSGKELSDTARYSMIGDSVAVPVVEMIARRIAQELD